MFIRKHFLNGALMTDGDLYSSEQIISYKRFSTKPHLQAVSEDGITLGLLPTEVRC